MTFDVLHNLGPIRATKHQHKIAFSKNTVVKRSTSFTDNIYLECSAFCSVLHGHIDMTNLIDLIGHVIEVGELTNVVRGSYKLNGYWINFKIKDKDGNVIKCCAIGKTAVDFNNRYKETDGGDAVCVLRWWKVYEHLHGPNEFSVWSHGSISESLINPDYPEVQELMRMFSISNA